MGRCAVLVFILSSFLSAEGSPQDDQKRIDQSIQKGAEFLLGKYEKEFDLVPFLSTHELLMYTLLHTQIPRDHPVLRRGLPKLEGCSLEYTYQVSLLAMTLGLLDPRKYQDRLAHCAQWLVDTQLVEGEWSYPSWPPKAVHIDPPARKASGAPEGDPSPRIRIRRRPKTVVENEKLRGDISNAQFAILGLRACLDAGIEIPRYTWETAFDYFAKNQNQDGGWGYCYFGSKPKESYASITCAGVVSMMICRYAQGIKAPGEDPSIRKGLDWLSRNFQPDTNTNVEKRTALENPLRYFYLYSVERVGRIAGMDKIGGLEWYPAGSQFLLKMQKKDGSWWDGLERAKWKLYGDAETTDTCFAILFLSTATRPLTPTLDTRK